MGKGDPRTNAGRIAMPETIQEDGEAEAALVEADGRMVPPQRRGSEPSVVHAMVLPVGTEALVEMVREKPGVMVPPC